MKKARFVLKIVAMSLAAAGAICAIVAYGDCLKEACGKIVHRSARKVEASEYDDYEE